MKKAIVVVLLLVVMLSLFACGKNGNETDETENYDYNSVLTETGVDLDIGSVIIE